LFVCCCCFFFQIGVTVISCYNLKNWTKLYFFRLCVGQMIISYFELDMIE